MNVPFRLYLITDGADGQDARIEAALGALGPGEAAVQLRAPGLGGGALHERAAALRALTRRRGALLLVNDRLDVALAVGADGAHLPTHGLPVAAARRVAPALLLGASTHSLDQARAAARDGADLVVFGPVWPTASHPGAPGVGAAVLAEVARALAVPVFALGGVTRARAHEVAAAGARAACLRGVLDDPDPARAARTLADGLAR